MSPTMDQATPQPTQFADMGHACAFCNNRSFRRSRLKSTDLGGLLLLRYPVRCLKCSQRQSVSLSVAMRAVPSSVHQVRAPRQPGARSSVAATQTQTQPLGGGSFPTLRGLQPVVMPDLHGVALEHHAPAQPGMDNQPAD